MISTRLGYPETVRQDIVDDYHGTTVPDPYRWLEDDNAADTKAWVVAQNKVTYNYLDQIPERARLKERLTKLWNFERYGIPFKQGGRYFFSKNDGLQNQGVLYVTEALDAAPRVLLDPNILSSDGTVALSGYRLSEDGNFMAYGLSTSGSDWNEWKVRDVRTGADLADHLKWVKFSGASWTKDGKGFFYSRYDAPKSGDALKGVNKFQKLYYHKLGTAQSDDALIYERRDQPDWGFGGSVTDDGRFLLISISQGTDPRNRVYYRDLTRQLWDEARHAMMGEVGFVSVGVDWPRHVMVNFTWALGLDTQLTPKERHAVLYFIEQGLMPRTGKRHEWEVGVMSKNPLAATFQDFDWADEVLHARVGRDWYVSDMPSAHEAVAFGDRCWSKVLMGWEEWRRQGHTAHRNWWPDTYASYCSQNGIVPDPDALAFSTSYQSVRADLKDISASA